MEENIIKGTLDWINKIRGAFGLKPVNKIRKGYPNNPHSCPIARTIVGRSTKIHCSIAQASCTIKETVGGTVALRVSLDEAPARFVIQFDSGGHGEYRI